MTMSSTTRVKNMCGLIPGYFTRYMPMPKSIAIRQDICISLSSFHHLGVIVCLKLTLTQAKVI